MNVDNPSTQLSSKFAHTCLQKELMEGNFEPTNGNLMSIHIKENFLVKYFATGIFVGLTKNFCRATECLFKIIEILCQTRTICCFKEKFPTELWKTELRAN